MSRGIHIAVIAILLIGGFGTYASHVWRAAYVLTPDDVAGLPERLARIPLTLEEAGFRGTPEVLEDSVVEMSGADHYATIVYRDSDHATVRLHVGAAARTEAWFHEPTVCLPSHGWTSSPASLVPIWTGLAGASAEDRVWRMTLHKSGEDLIVYYWLQYGQHIVTTRFDRAVRRFEGLLAAEKDQPTQIVILYASVRGGEEKTEQRVATLVRALWPHLYTVLSSGEEVHAASKQ